MNELTYGDWLKIERNKRRLSQETLGKMAGKHRTHVNRIERGGIGLPDPDTRAEFHEALGTSEDDLVDVGILVKQIDPRTGEAHYEPAPRIVQVAGHASGSSSASGDLTIVSTPATATVTGHPVEVTATTGLSPYQRASFLRVGELEGDRRRIAEGMLDGAAYAIDKLADEAAALREQMRIDRERRKADGIEE